jgi:threonine dehydrogenase-like Zn-dependent dehydrogenase
MIKICMIGTGYVGLVSGACLADFGHHVTCVDIDGERIDRLRQGEIPIYEPGLKDVVVKNVQGERLYFTKDLASAVKDADVVFIAVGTPSRRRHGPLVRLRAARRGGISPTTRWWAEEHRARGRRARCTPSSTRPAKRPSPTSSNRVPARRLGVGDLPSLTAS